MIDNGKKRRRRKIRRRKSRRKEGSERKREGRDAEAENPVRKRLSRPPANGRETQAETRREARIQARGGTRRSPSERNGTRAITAIAKARSGAKLP